MKSIQISGGAWKDPSVAALCIEVFKQARKTRSVLLELSQSQSPTLSQKRQLCDWKCGIVQGAVHFNDTVLISDSSQVTNQAVSQFETHVLQKKRGKFLPDEMPSFSLLTWSVQLPDMQMIETSTGTKLIGAQCLAKTVRSPCKEARGYSRESTTTIRYNNF